VTVHEAVRQWVTDQGLAPGGSSELVATGLLAAGVLLLSLVADFVGRRLIVRAVAAVIRRTETEWDDAILERHVFDRLSRLAPAMVLYLLIEFVVPDRASLIVLVHRG